MRHRTRRAHWRITDELGRRWKLTWLPHARWLVAREVKRGRGGRSYMLDVPELMAAFRGARLLGTDIRRDDPRQAWLFHELQGPVNQPIVDSPPCQT